MKEELIAFGNTIEEAVESGRKQLGLSLDELEVVVLEQPKSRFFGLKKEPAKVKLVYEVVIDKAQVSMELLKSYLKAFSLPDVSLKLTENESAAMIELSGEGLSFMLENEGETLDAIQHLLGISVNMGTPRDEYFRILLDIDGFREERIRALEAHTNKLAESVIRTGRSVTLEPMTPYQRRIVHAAVQEMGGLESSSVGTEPRRSVIIKLAQKKSE